MPRVNVACKHPQLVGLFTCWALKQSDREAHAWKLVFGHRSARVVIVNG